MTEREFKKLNFTVDNLSEAQKEKTKTLIAALKNSKDIISALENNNIPVEYAETAPWKIREWIKGMQPCNGCKGLQDCRQKKKGFYSNLVYDGILHFNLSACAYQNDKNRAEAHLENYLLAEDLPDRMKTVSFKNIDLENEDEDYVSTYVRITDLCDEGKSVYLYGSMGAGKTFLAACAANKYAREGKSVAFIHYPTFVQRLASRVANGEYRTELDRMKFAQFAVIDDIGAENCTEWNRDSILLPIISARYEKGLPTWFTSNYNTKILAQHFTVTNKGNEEEAKAARIIERISVMCMPIKLTGSDRRKKL